MKKILIALGALIIVGASAGAGYYVMSGPVRTNVEEAIAAYQDPVSDPRYVDIDSLVLPVVRNGRIRHHMFVRLSLEVDGKDTAQKILERKVRLHHAFYMALYDGPIQMPDGNGLDIDRMKSIVEREAGHVMGEGFVQAVHIRQVVPGQE